MQWLIGIGIIIFILWVIVKIIIKIIIEITPYITTGLFYVLAAGAMAGLLVGIFYGIKNYISSILENINNRALKFIMVAITFVFIFAFLGVIIFYSQLADEFWIDDKIEMEMVFVKGGAFTMGCTVEQGNDCFNYEKPKHRVTVSDFFIGKYEVTQGQWVKIMGNNPSRFKGDNLPVENVSWDEIQEFIRRLNSSITERQYRLPTEAEWEYAARGGLNNKKYKYAGSTNIHEVVWFKNNSNEKTHPVGTKWFNELGIHDMNGNVWEWVNDWYEDYDSGSQVSPQGPSSGSWRVRRGGGWASEAEYSRVSCRSADSSTHRSAGIGFRIASSNGEAPSTNFFQDAVASNSTPDKISKLVGIWEGSYYTGQGEIGLTLDVYEENGGYKANFRFYNLAGKMNTKEGEYIMNVSYIQTTGMYNFRFQEWIKQPSGYTSLNLNGTLNGDVFSGKTNQRKTFSVTRKSLERAESSPISITNPDMFYISVKDNNDFYKYTQLKQNI